MRLEMDRARWRFMIGDTDVADIAVQGRGCSMFDEEDARKPAGKMTDEPFRPRVLDRLSVDDLQEYIAEMETEIARAREAITQKKSATAAADSVFKF